MVLVAEPRALAICKNSSVLNFFRALKTNFGWRRITPDQKPLLPGLFAPSFALPTSFGEVFNLQEHLQQRAQLVVFVPHAFTPVCSQELQELCDFAAVNPEIGVALISCDAKHTLYAWQQVVKDCDNLVLLSDYWPHGAVAKKFGVFNSASGAAYRTSFLVSQAGKISAVIAAPAGQKRQLTAYVKALKTLRHA